MGSSYDRLTQLILLALADESPLTTSEIVAETGADTNQAVHYRCKNHLIPNGNVARANDPQKGRATKYALTADGATYVALMKRDLETPESGTKALEMAQEALEIAREAQQTADSTSGKLGQLERDANKAIEAADNAANTALEVRSDAADRAEGRLRKDFKEFAEGIDEAVVHPWKEIEETFYEMQEKQEEILERLDELEGGECRQYAKKSDVREVESDVNSLRHSNRKRRKLDDRVKELESDMNQVQNKLETTIISWLIPTNDLNHRR